MDNDEVNLKIIPNTQGISKFITLDYKGNGSATKWHVRNMPRVVRHRESAFMDVLLTLREESTE